MTEQTDLENHVTQTFDALRGEVALLRRAIEGLSAERESMPDYGPTLTNITVRMDAFIRWGKQINDKPAMAFTPESLEREIARVARAARDDDHVSIAHAAQRMDSVSSKIAGFMASASTSSEQQRLVSITGCVAFLFGMLLILGLIAVDRPPAKQPLAPPAIEAVSKPAGEQRTSAHEHRPGSEKKHRHSH